MGALTVTEGHVQLKEVAVVASSVVTAAGVTGLAMVRA
jgi:hypothetical protein